MTQARFSSLARLCRRTLTGAALAFLFVGPSAAAQDVAIAESAPAVQHADPAMWVIRDEDSTIYLFGTVHLLRPEVAWRSDKIDAALAEADQVWLEIADLDDQAAALPLIQQYGLAAPDQPLSSLLNEAEQAQLDQAARMIGASGAALDPLRPWLAGLQVSVAAIVHAGYSPDSGVDPQIKAAAVAAGKPVKGLETMEQQFGFFANLSQDTQLDFLRYALDTYEEAPEELDRMVAAWAVGDMGVMEEVAIDEMKAEWGELYDVILVRRNADWTGQIARMLQGSGTHFIAVGAAHLAGEDSVQNMLQQRGVTVERH